MFFNVASSATKYFYSGFGIHEELNDITEMTPTSFTPDQLYTSNLFDVEYIKNYLNDIQNSTDNEEWMLDTVFGEHFSLLKYYYYTAVESFRPRVSKYMNNEQDVIQSLLHSAKMSDNPNIYELLGQIYLQGESALGIMPNRELADLFFLEAEAKGSSLAMFNLAITKLDIDPKSSYFRFLELTKNKDGFEYFGYYGLSLMHFKGLYVEQDFEVAYKYANLCLDTSFWAESSLLFSKILYYDSNLRDINSSYEYLDIAMQNPNLAKAYMTDLEREYLSNVYFGPYDCKEIITKVRNLQGVNEMDDYYKLGYKKYIMGEFDQALIIFSFCAMNGRYR